MGRSIEIRTSRGGGLGDIVSRLNRLQSLVEPSPEDLLELGNVMWEANQDRTARGVDARGQTFQPYTRKYALYKAKHGGSTNPVDLMGVGRSPEHMLVEMEVWSDNPNEVKIGFLNKASFSAMKALGHIHGFIERNLPVRRFLGIHSDDKAGVIAKRAEQIRGHLKGF